MLASMPIRVILIDDDPNIHDMVRDLIGTTSDILLVGQAYRGIETRFLCQHSDPDIILMDVKMPGMSGAEATRQAMNACPGVRVLVLSSFHEYESIKEMLDSGASGYLVKGALFDDLLETIRFTHQGHTVLSKEVALKVFSPPNQGATRAFNLTSREIEVLSMLGQGLNNSEIAQQLSISVPTVRFHLKNLIEKLGVETRSEALVLASKQGLI